jgi:hypothetical protein
MKDAPFGTDTSQQNDDMFSCYYCCCCQIANWLMKALFEEVIFFIDEKRTQCFEMLTRQDETMKSAGNCIRPLGILLSMFGWYLLFAPFIQLLSWIPLVGWLLGGIVWIVAVITGFIVGGMSAAFVMAIAWIVFRPLYGVLLLTLVSLGAACLFYLPKYL